MSEQDLMKGNLHTDGVKAEDNTKEFFYLADLRKITGSIFTIDGGYITASMG